MADSSDDAIRELVACLYGSMDNHDMSTFDALVSSRVVVEVGSSAPMGLEEWRAHHIDRFQGDTVVGHRAQMDIHGLLAQLDGD